MVGKPKAFFSVLLKRNAACEKNTCKNGNSLFMKNFICYDKRSKKDGNHSVCENAKDMGEKLWKKFVKTANIVMWICGRRPTGEMFFIFAGEKALISAGITALAKERGWMANGPGARILHPARHKMNRRNSSPCIRRGQNAYLFGRIRCVSAR